MLYGIDLAFEMSALRLLAIVAVPIGDFPGREMRRMSSELVQPLPVGHVEPDNCKVANITDCMPRAL